MGPVFLFSLAASQARWLATRQAAIASNVANANTPGYRAIDVVPFDKTLDGHSKVVPSVTSPLHIAADDLSSAAEKVRKSESWEVVHSGNTVSVEQEMLKAGDVNRDYALSTAIVKSFHRMFTAAAKG